MRMLSALAVSAALLTGGCTYDDGSFNAPGTLALGAGAALAGVLIASSHSRPSHYERSYSRQNYAYGPGYGRPSYGYGQGHYGHQRW